MTTQPTLDEVKAFFERIPFFTVHSYTLSEVGDDYNPVKLSPPGTCLVVKNTSVADLEDPTFIQFCFSANGQMLEACIYPDFIDGGMLDDLEIW